VSDQHKAPHDEKRRFSRIPFDANVLLSKDGKEWRSKLIDISFKGILIETPKNWDGVNGEHFFLEVIFADSGSLIRGNVAVAHIENRHVGFEITQIDVESVGHLRRLVELNIGNPELLDRELTALNWR
jgi:PilZ domain